MSFYRTQYLFNFDKVSNRFKKKNIFVAHVQRRDNTHRAAKLTSKKCCTPNILTKINRQQFHKSKPTFSTYSITTELNKHPPLKHLVSFSINFFLPSDLDWLNLHYPVPHHLETDSLFSAPKWIRTSPI